MARPRSRKNHPVLSDTALARVAARFRALGDPSRLKILNRLMRGELAVGDLVEETGLTQTNASRHLAVLRREGIVERRAIGNRALYRVADDTMFDVCDLVCGSLEDQLAGELENLRRTGS